MTIKEYLKSCGLTRVAKGEILDARFAAALAERPLWEMVEESKEELGEAWDKIIDSSHYRKLKWSCRKDSPYVLVYNDVAEDQSGEAHCPITKEQLQKFFDNFRNDEWKSLSWLSNLPESRVEKAVLPQARDQVEISKNCAGINLHLFTLNGFPPVPIWCMHHPSMGINIDAHRACFAEIKKFFGW